MLIKSMFPRWISVVTSAFRLHFCTFLCSFFYFVVKILQSQTISKDNLIDTIFFSATCVLQTAINTNKTVDVYKGYE